MFSSSSRSPMIVAVALCAAGTLALASSIMSTSLRGQTNAGGFGMKCSPDDATNCEVVNGQCKAKAGVPSSVYCQNDKGHPGQCLAYTCNQSNSNGSGQSGGQGGSTGNLGNDSTYGNGANGTNNGVGAQNGGNALGGQSGGTGPSFGGGIGGAAVGGGNMGPNNGGANGVSNGGATGNTGNLGNDSTYGNGSNGTNNGVGAQGGVGNALGGQGGATGVNNTNGGTNGTTGSQGSSNGFASSTQSSSGNSNSSQCGEYVNARWMYHRQNSPATGWASDKTCNAPTESPSMHYSFGSRCGDMMPPAGTKCDYWCGGNFCPTKGGTQSSGGQSRSSGGQSDACPLQRVVGMSDNGQFILLTQGNLIPQPIYLIDRQSHTTTLVGKGKSPSISRSGQFVGYFQMPNGGGPADSTLPLAIWNRQSQNTQVLDRAQLVQGKDADLQNNASQASDRAWVKFSADDQYVVSSYAPRGRLNVLVIQLSTSATSVAKSLPNTHMYPEKFTEFIPLDGANFIFRNPQDGSFGPNNQDGVSVSKNGNTVLFPVPGTATMRILSANVSQYGYPGTWSNIQDITTLSVLLSLSADGSTVGYLSGDTASVYNIPTKTSAELPSDACSYIYGLTTDGKGVLCMHRPPNQGNQIFDLDTIYYVDRTTGVSEKIEIPQSLCDASKSDSESSASNSQSGSSGPSCGDGIVQSGEQCDDGTFNNQMSGSFCSPSCKWDMKKCGLCTGRSGGDSCENSATLCANNGAWGCMQGPLCYGLQRNVCGNAFVESGEQCDHGKENGANRYCDTNCTITSSTCGNGQLDEDAGEVCDAPAINRRSRAADGYPRPDDLCGLDCQWNPDVCGDGIRQIHEECDSGSKNSDTPPADLTQGHYCTTQCRLATK